MAEFILDKKSLNLCAGKVEFKLNNLMDIIDQNNPSFDNK